MKINLSIQEYNQIVELIETKKKLSLGIVLSLLSGVLVLLLWGIVTWNLAASYGLFLLLLAVVISQVMKFSSADPSILPVISVLFIYIFLSVLGVVMNAWILVSYRYETNLLLSFWPKWSDFVKTFEVMFNPFDIFNIAISVYIMVRFSRKILDEMVYGLYVQKRSLGKSSFCKEVTRD